MSLHPNLYVGPSPIHGLGLFASRPIEMDELIGRILTRPATEDGPHVLWLDDQRAVEVTNDLRFINHHPEPNACYYDDGTVLALRTIQAGEEITHDYGLTRAKTGDDPTQEWICTEV